MDEQQTYGSWNSLNISYTPRLPYDEARRLLLFAHKICLEDPLAQILDPIVRNINNRVYEFMLPPQNPRDIVFPRSLRVEPSEIHDGHLSLLRDTLVNTQRLAKLIRRKIVIPHKFIDVDITEHDWNPRDYPRWPNIKNRYAMEDAAALLGNLLAQGSLTGFGFPDALVEAAKAFRGSEDNLEGHHWIHGFFLDFPVEAYPPLEHWVDFLYRIMMYDRYHAVKSLGYSQYFTHTDGYKLLSIIEAADLAQSAPGIDVKDYAKRMTGDRVLVHRLESNLRPNASILRDDDIIKIRLEEELFEEWRSIIRESLQAVESFNAATGRTDGNAIREEIHERMSKWSEARRKRLKSSFLRTVVDVGEGAFVSFVTGLAVSDPEGVPALALGAAYTTLRASARLFSWRRRDKLINRHFLSIT